MKEMGILWGKMTPSDKEKYSNKAKGIKVESPAGLLSLPLTLYISSLLLPPFLPLSLPHMHTTRSCPCFIFYFVISNSIGVSCNV